MASVETRNAARDSMFMFGEVAFDGRPDPVRVKVRNVSAGGMMAEAAVAAMSGQLVTVTLRNIGDVRGTVAWVQGNRFGVAFAHQIDAAAARAPVIAEPIEAPRYARPALSTRQLNFAPGQLRRV